MTRGRLACVLSLAAVLAPAMAPAATYRLAHTFKPADSEPGDLFGQGLDLQGDVAVIRSRADYTGGPPARPNQTHLFRQLPNGGWDEEQVITLDWAGYWVGREVALDGDTLVQGLSWNDQNGERGEVSFYRRQQEGWAPQGIEAAPTPENRTDRNTAEFRLYRAFTSALKSGRTVDADDGYAVNAVAWPYQPNGSGESDKYSGLIYRKIGDGSWAEAAHLSTPPELNGALGAAIDGDLAVLSHHRLDSEEGALSVHQRNDQGGWERVAVVSAPAGSKINRLIGVAISDRTIVSQGFDSTPGSSRNNVFLTQEEDGAWSQPISLDDSPIAPEFVDGAIWRAIDGNYGLVAIEGDLIAHGVLAGQDSHVRLYRRDAAGEWLFADAIPAPDPATASGFGWSIAIDGGRILVGGSSFFLDPDVAGAAYLFAPVPECSAGCLAILASLAVGWRRGGGTWLG